MKSSRDPVPDGSGLTGISTALYIYKYIVFIYRTRCHKRLTNYGL